MNRDEIVEYLCHDSHYYKKDLRTIKNIIEGGAQIGYTITKKGPDIFDIIETNTIKDFTKPLIIHRDIPPLAPTECYSGVPIGVFYSLDHFCGKFSITLWCYLANKQDDNYIHFSDLRSYFDSDDEIAEYFDGLVSYGYLKETDTNLEFYFYPQVNNNIRFPHEKEYKRLTPLKFLD